MADLDVTAGDLVDRLHTRYPAPEWASFEELRDGPGFAQRRTIDFFTLNTWPSKGLGAIAVEVKVDRADFRRELDLPSKRSTIIPYVKEFWFCAPKGVIPQAELPDGLGLLETWGGKLRATVRARQFSDRKPDAELFTVIARRCADDRERLRRGNEDFAEFRGKIVGIADLRRLASKLFDRWTFRDSIEKEIEAELREQFKKHRGACFLSDHWLQVLEKLWEKIRRADPDLSWNAEPDHLRARAFIEAIETQKNLVSLARRLREFADQVDPPGVKELET